MTVIGNLLDNACHAAGESGRVRLFFTDLGEQLLIEVEDSGPGVLPSHSEAIFAEGFSTKPGKHRGIGLALVKRLCHEHGGEITLEEGELDGACFTVVLDRSLSQLQTITTTDMGEKCTLQSGSPRYMEY